MENKQNPNGVKNESEVVKKAAPPPMKRAQKGEKYADVAKAAKKAEENKKVKEENKKPEKKATKEVKKEVEPVVAQEIKEQPKTEMPPVVKEEPKVIVPPVAQEQPKATVPSVAQEQPKVIVPPVVQEQPEAKVPPVTQEKTENKTPSATQVQQAEAQAVPVVNQGINQNVRVSGVQKNQQPNGNVIPPVTTNTAGVSKEKKKNKNLLLIIIPIIAIVLVAIIVAGVLVAKRNRLDPIVVTDEHGVPVTDENGKVITVTPETEVIVLTDVYGNPITDSEGNVMTTVVYKDLTAQIPVTDMNGAIVTDANGNVVTENVSVDPTGNSGVTNGGSLGTTAVIVTDGKGNTGVDEQGNLITTIVNITEPPVIDIEPAKTEWKNTQGGSSMDKYRDVTLTSDGGYITTNVTSSVDGDFSQFKELGLSTPYSVLTKYDKDGNIVWQKAMGYAAGPLELVALSSAENGSFYAVGYGRAIENLRIRGWYDGAIYKFDKNGNIIWVNSFGTSTVDIFYDVITTANGDAVVVGSSGNNDGDASGSGGNANESKAVILRYSSNGELLWKQFAGGNMDLFVGVAETKDGSIFALGNFYSGKLFPALGKCDSGIVKYDKNGKLLKQVSIAGSGIDEFKSIIATSDGNILVCGSSNSSDTDNNSFFKNDLASRGGFDSYIIKYTPELLVDFATPLRGQNNDTASSVIELSNGTYIMAGSTNSSTRDFKGVTTRGKKDIFVASFNKDGTLIWVRSFGGTENDGALALCKGGDGGYVVVGETFSNNVDLNKISPYGGNGKSLGVMVKFPE